MSQSPTPFDYDAALAHCLSTQHHNIAPHILANGDSVWVRRAGAPHARWRYRLLGVVAGCLKLQILTPVPNWGGAVGIATEARRLQQLRAAGIAVPVLLAQQSDALMMSNIGQHNLLREWQNQRHAPAVLLQRWQSGLDAIATVHRQGQYLSQAFARNLMYDGHCIGFIDFEDDPGSVMPLALCQARDWLCYLHSGARLMQQAGILTAACRGWQQTLGAADVAVARHVNRAVRCLRPLRGLQAEYWGSDTLRLAAMACFAAPPASKKTTT